MNAKAAQRRGGARRIIEAATVLSTELRASRSNFAHLGPELVGRRCHESIYTIGGSVVKGGGGRIMKDESEETGRQGDGGDRRIAAGELAAW